MAERFRSTNQSNPSRNRTAAPQPAIRRNIFQGAGPNARAARRPGPVSADSAETILDVEAPEPESTEIVVRDCHGEIVMDDLPTLELDELGEDEDEEGKQEMEQERQRLSEAIKKHQNSTEVLDQPEELLEPTRVELRKKIAKLSEDDWMYETEDNARGA